MIAHQYDAIIGIAGCDKSLPGTLMGMARVNMPAIFLYGGTILPGRWNNCDVTIQDVYEAVGAYEVGKLSLQQLTDLENVACPSAGSCGECILPTRWLQLAKPLGYHCLEVPRPLLKAKIEGIYLKKQENQSHC